MSDADLFAAPTATRTGWPYEPTAIAPSVDPHRFVLLIPGEPVAKGRPKLGTVNGHAMAFTPKKTRQYESIVREIAVREWGHRPLLRDTALSITAHFYLRIPVSKPKRWREAAAMHEVRPLSKPDLSNLVKAIEDGMQGVVFQDDSAIVATAQAKWYDNDPRVEVVLTW